MFRKNRTAILSIALLLSSLAALAQISFVAAQPADRGGGPQEGTGSATASYSGHIDSLYKRRADLGAQFIGQAQPWPDIFMPRCTADRLPSIRIPLYLREYPEKKFLIPVALLTERRIVEIETPSAGGCIVKELAKSQGWKVTITVRKDDLTVVGIDELAETPKPKSK